MANAVDVLRKDHKKVLELLNCAVRVDDRLTSADLDWDVIEELTTVLRTHTAMEEHVFYPAMERFDDTRELVESFCNEHRAIDQLLYKISGAPDDAFARLLALTKIVELHIDEEERELFPQAEWLLSRSQLEQLGDKMEPLRRGHDLTFSR